MAMRTGGLKYENNISTEILKDSKNGRPPDFKLNLKLEGEVREHVNHLHCSNSLKCDHYKGGKIKGVCTPKMTPDLKEWMDRKERGEMVGRAPDWPCPFFIED